MSFFNTNVPVVCCVLMTRFNPCFSGCLSSTAKRGACCQGLISVSILVLVDVFLQRGPSQSCGAGTQGFNPCFSGCLSSTYVIYLTCSQSPYVSILVLVDVFLQREFLAMSQENKPLQFFWKFPIRTARPLALAKIYDFGPNRVMLTCCSPLTFHLKLPFRKYFCSNNRHILPCILLALDILPSARHPKDL